jgi:hypothetical protein
MKVDSATMIMKIHFAAWISTKNIQQIGKSIENKIFSKKSHTNLFCGEDVS